MIRRKLLLALLVLVPVAAYVAVPSASPPATFGDNTEDTAVHRWMTNQPTHWRHVVVHR